MEVFKLNNSFYDIVSYINLITNCYVAIVSIVHCWEFVKRDIAGQDTPPSSAQKVFLKRIQQRMELPLEGLASERDP